MSSYYDPVRWVLDQMHLDPAERQHLAVETCQECGNPVLDSEEYYDFDGEIVCDECAGSYLRAHRKIVYPMDAAFQLKDKMWREA